LAGFVLHLVFKFCHSQSWGSKHGAEGNLHFIESLYDKGYSVMIRHLGNPVL